MNAESIRMVEERLVGKRSACLAGVLALLLAVFLPVGVMAQQPEESRATDWAVARIAKFSGSLVEQAKIREVMLRNFQSADLDGDGVTEDDYALAQQMREAQQRAQSVSVMLLNDLDGDGAVSRTELEEQFRARSLSPVSVDGVMLTPTPEQAAIRLAKLVEGGMRGDRDGDGVIALDEMLAVASSRASFGSTPDDQRVVPMFLDGNGDGVVTQDEYMAVFERAFRRIDGDGDGVISPAESAAIAGQARATAEQEAKLRREQELARRAAEEARKQAATCGLPKAPAESRVLLLSTYDGTALSAAAIGGEDEEIMVVDLRIEPGSEPLYVVVSSYHAMIWRFSGAVERVVTVVADSFTRAAGGTPRAGVSGIPESRIRFPGDSDCVPGYKAAKAGNPDSPTLKRFSAAIDHDIDKMFYRHDGGLVTLPAGTADEAHKFSGRIDVPAGTPGEPYWRELKRSYPGGLVRIDPKSVVSPLPVAEFKVLPQQAGLAQLLDEGALTPQGRIQGMLFDELRKAQEQPGYQPKFTYSPAALVIRRKITYPAGLYGAHSVTFILPPGVPEPDGTAGHSRVIRKDPDAQ